MFSLSKNLKNYGFVFFVLLIFYAIFGFYLLPYWVTNKLPGVLTEKAGIDIKIDRFDVNPFAFKFVLSGFSLSTPKTKTLVSFDKLSIKLNPWLSLTNQGIVLDKIDLSKPVISIKREVDGQLNFKHLFLSEKPNKLETDHQRPATLPFSIRNINLTNGQINWQDDTFAPAFTESLTSVNLSVSNLGNLPDLSGSFALSTGLASGGHLHWEGDLSLLSFNSNGLIELDGVQVTKHLPVFMPKFRSIKLNDAGLFCKMAYQTSLLDDQFALTIDKSEIELKQFEIWQSEQENSINIPSISIKGLSFDLQKHQMKLGKITSKNGVFKLVLYPDGRINLENLLQSDQTSPALSNSTNENTSAPNWSISLDEFNIENNKLIFNDQRFNALELRLESINFNLQQISNLNDQQSPLKFRASFQDLGKININGMFNYHTLETVLDIDLKKLPITSVENYLNDYVNLDIIDGDINSQAHIQLNLKDSLQLLVQGNADLENLLTRDLKNNQNFLKWLDLKLENIDFDLAKQNLVIGQVLFDKPYIRIAVKKDRSSNLNDVFVTKSKKSDVIVNQEHATLESNKTSPNINIGKIVFLQGSSDFSDYSLILPFIANMNELSGILNGFSTNNNKTVNLDLKGKVYDLAQVAIEGQYQLQTSDSDFALKFNHLPLPLITPYMADFAGYKIEKGQMSLDLRYKVKQDQLDVQNKILIDQLALGEQIQNPHASRLPLQLAIALLKDSDGRINLDFPVYGSLNDPQFNVGDLIKDVLSNFVGKLVTSPFKVLGLVGSDQEQDFSSINFTPGSAELTGLEKAKLDQLASALQNRPYLTLEVKGIAYKQQDWSEMQEAALIDILKKMQSDELRKQGENIRSEYLDLSENDIKRQLTKFFKQVFPEEIDLESPTKPQIKNQPEADFYVVARQKLKENLQVDLERLNDLAIARANNISKYFVDKAGIDIGRIYILAPELDMLNQDKLITVLSLNSAH